MNDWRLWAILVISVGGLLYSVISNYAVRGNELKHIKDDIGDLKKHLCREIKQVVGRIERLENRLFKDR